MSIFGKQDISKSLQAKAQYCKALFDHVADAVVVADAAGRIVDVNLAAENYFGVRRSNLVGRRIVSLHPRTTRKQAARIFFDFVAARRALLAELPVLAKGGNVRLAEIKASRLDIAGRRYLLGTFRDITEVRRLEDQSRLSAVLAEAAHDSIFVIDRRGIVTYVNEFGARQFQAPPAAIIGKNVLKLFPRDVGRRYLASIMRVFRSGKPLLIESPAAFSGAFGWLSTSLAPIRFSSGRIEAVMGVSRDITERKDMEQVMDSHISLFNSIMHSINDGLLVIDLKGKVSYYNDQFRRLWHIPDQVIKTNDDGQLLKFVLNQLAEPQEFMSKVKYLYKHPAEKSDDDIRFKDGRIFRRISMPQILKGKIVGRVWNFRDLTHHRQAESRIEESEQRLQDIFDYSSVAIFLVGLDGSFLRANRMAERLWGYSDSELKGMTFAQITHPDEAQRDLKKIKEMVAGKLDVYRVDKRYIRKDGKIIWARLNANLIRDRQGRPLYFLSVAEDITERKKIAEDLERSENKYRRLFEAAKDGIIMLDVNNGEITEINPYLANLLGYERRQFIGRKIWDISLFSDIIASRSAFEELRAKGYIHYDDLPLKTKSGQTIEVEFVSNVYGINGERVVQCNIRDISERKRVEKFRLLSEMQYRDFMEKSSDGIVIIQGGLVKFANQAMEKMTGFRAEKIINRPMLDFIAPEFKQLVAEKYRQRMAGIPVDTRYEFSIITSDRRNIPVETNSSIINFEGGLADMAIIRDVSRSKEIDRIKSEFIAVASHQLRTPLTGIKWFSQLLLNDKQVNLTEAQSDYLKSIFESNERMIKLVNDLLDVSHIETGHKFSVVRKRTDAVAIIKRIIHDPLIVAKARSIRIELAKKTLAKLVLPLDEKKFEQVLINLIGNSIKYSGRGKRIIVSAGKIGNEAYFSVKDFGLGIPKSQQHRIFEKFFRADNIATISQEGTGLGLYIAKSIVEGHGGKIKFESKENKGTTFYFTLPLK